MRRKEGQWLLLQFRFYDQIWFIVILIILGIMFLHQSNQSVGSSIIFPNISRPSDGLGSRLLYGLLGYLHKGSRPFEDWEM